MANNINTGKHVGAKFTEDDVTLVILNIQALMLYYQTEHGVGKIPSALKLYEMLKFIRENEKPDIKAVAKEVPSEILSPAQTGEKTTKKQQIVEAAKT